MVERKIVKGLPSSFVASNMKLASETGSGEAKLWVGQQSNARELDVFFRFEEGYTYTFSRKNMLEYMQQVKIEYVYQKFNKYRDASLGTWNEQYIRIRDLPENDFKINLSKFTDRTRYYVRADEVIFKQIFRSIAVPKLTNVVFEKDEENKKITLLLELNLEYENVDNEHDVKLCFNTTLDLDIPRNRIVFGAPGTGKSFTINRDRIKVLGENNETDYERVTFHPDYSYAQFVGTYKPIMTEKDGNEVISYEYVPGPFMRMYVKALKNAMTDSPKPYILIIEEINRANVAAVFGDVFQLLDRDDDGVSEYPIQASEDIKKYLLKELGIDIEKCEKIRIPNNLFIWATMNSADQGVFPMDTAFKRRWDFTYLGIDDNDEDIRGKYVEMGSKEKQRVEWNELRKAINEFLADNKINEDKQLGPYFIARNIVVPADGGSEINSEKFCDVFKHKVLMYLFDDAAKQKRGKIFEGSAKGQNRYSKVCEAFDEQGIGIFHSDIQTKVKIKDLVSNDRQLDENGMVTLQDNE